MFTIENDKRLKKKLKDFSKRQAIKGFDVGFFKQAKYPDGTSVAQVAISNEFGVPSLNIPERPFFRIANEKVKPKLLKQVKVFIDQDSNYVMTDRDVGRMAQMYVAAVQESITNLREPPNATRTVNRKKSSNPLIDTGVMRQSVTYKVVR